MSKSRNRTIYPLLVWILTIAMTACQSAIELPQATGCIHISLKDISTTTATRSTPQEIGTPDLEKFDVAVCNAAGEVCYRGKLSNTDVPLLAGTYSVTVSGGDNPLIGIDSPYYSGTVQNVLVQDGQKSQVDVECKVANSLISARFGRDDTEHQRFSKFYESYELRVHVGNGYYASITDRKSFQSAYFHSGSSITLEFAGVLQATGQHVSAMLNLSGTAFPTTFAPADHAIVTLSLPDPQNLLAINISKVEMEEESVSGTIPVDWFPVPKAEVSHTFDAEGCLTGTDVDFGNGYPGFEWKAELQNAANTIVRSVQGNGTLASTHNQSGVEWPYLPSGQYQAHFYIILNGVETETGTRTVNVNKPTVQVSVDGYTSYSKYRSGDIDGANSCDAYTVYAPKASVGISQALLDNAKYTSSIVTTVAGKTLAGTRSGHSFTYSDVTEIDPSLAAYSLACTATFADVTATGSKNLRITGLPITFAPPSQSAGWSGKGTVAWTDSDNGTPRIRLGQNTTSQPQYITCSKFAIPSGTKMNCPYRVATYGATVATTLTLSVGSYEYLSQSSGRYSGFKEYNSNETTFTLTSDATSVKANNSYGSGQTRSYIYSLSYKYAK